MRSLLIKLTAGVPDTERVAQAFGVAGAGLSVGAQVSFWLSGPAVALAVPGTAEEVEIEFGPPIPEIRDLLIEHASLSVCAPCAQRRGMTPADFMAGVHVAGAAAFVEQALNDDTQALVY